MSHVQTVTTNEFSSRVLHSMHPVVVDFYADWCPPCRMLAPLVEELAAEYQGRIEFFKVNIDDSPELADQYRVSGVPTLLMFFGGKEVDRFVGVPPANMLQQKLERFSRLAPAGASPTPV